MAQYQTEEPTVAQNGRTEMVAEELTLMSMLLDPEYGLPATKALDKNAGLLLAPWKDRLMILQAPSACQTVWCLVCKRIKEQGADAVKFLLYYDVDSSEELNQQKAGL